MWISSILSAFVILNSFGISTAKHLQRAEDLDKDKFIYEKYIELDKNIKKYVNYGIKSALPYVMEANEHLNLTSRCGNNLFTLMASIKKLKLSAVKFLDASGKIPPGLITGTINMFGDYDECLDTEVLRADGNVAFRGQYCMIDIMPILPERKGKITIGNSLQDLLEYANNTSEVIQYMLSKAHYGYSISAKYGLCIPSGCSTEDVTAMLKYFGEKAFMNATVQYCDQQHEFQWHPGIIVAICFLSVAALLAIVGSSIDYYSRKKGVSFQNTTWNRKIACSTADRSVFWEMLGTCEMLSLESDKTARILMCFSVPTNFPKVISAKAQDSTLASVFGVRTLSLFFIILIHQYFYLGTVPVTGHAIHYENQIPQFFFQIVINAYYTVEVFFFLGGLLNTYTRVKLQENGRRQLTILQILVHRLWRIYPTYIFCMLVSYLFLEVRGPMSTYLKQDIIETCDEKWWKNLLFINNFFNQEKLCMAHTWYISVDMQLFLMSLFTVPVLLKDTKKGIILHVGVLIAGLAGTALWTWHKDLMPSLLVYYLNFDDIQRVRNAYVTTLPHIAPYFTGLITGYILSKWNEFKIPMICRLLGWPTAAACFLSVIFMTKNWNSGVEFTVIESVLYFPFSRLLYVLAVAWIVVCCARGYGGVINYILSLKIWIPFARISYMVYMISPLLQLNYYAALKMRIDNDYMTLIWRHLGDLGVSCLLGLAMTVTIESPFISMEKLIFHRSPAKKESTPNNVENAEKYTNKGDIISEMELEKNIKNIDENFKETDLEKNYKNMNVNIQ